MKILKYLLIGLAVLIVAAGAVLGYVAATFDPNAYKPQIVQAVKDRTQRTLKLEGDVKLTLFPSVGIRLGKATLSERGNDKPFAAIDDLRVAVKVLPLLSRRVVVDAVEIKGLRARLVRFKDGRTNFSDLAAAPPPASSAPAGRAPEGRQFSIDIAHVRIADTALTFVDETGGGQYELSGLSLKTGRIADGVPTDIELSTRARAEKRGVDLQIGLHTRAAYSAQSQHIRLEALALSAKGAAAGWNDLVASAKGDISAGPSGQAFSASGLTATVTGKRADERLEAKLALPKLTIARDQAAGQKLVFDVHLEGGKRKLVARIEIPAIEGRSGAVRATDFTADVEVSGEGPSTQLKLASPLSANLEQKRFELPKLAATARLADPQWAKSPVDARLNGALMVDGTKETATLTFSGKFDESSIDGRVGLARFTPPAYAFDVKMDKLDADRYSAKAEGKAKPAAKSGGGGGGSAGAPINLAAIKDLNANGTLRIGALKFANLKAANVRLDIKAANGKLDVSPMTANLYQGALDGALSAEAAATPVFTVRQKLTGVSIGPLLADLAGKDMLEGKGNVAIDLKAHGQTVAAVKKTLDGTVGLDLKDGAVKGVDIAGTLRSVQSKLGALKGETVQQADQRQKTDFTELRATFVLKNGVAHNDDLSIKSPLLRIGGAGNIDIGGDRLDYLVKASVVATAKGQGGRDLAQLQGVTVPVQVTGPLDSPSYKLDFNALVSETAKRKLEDSVKRELEKRLGGGSKDSKQGGGLKDQLKGLFGR